MTEPVCLGFDVAAVDVAVSIPSGAFSRDASVSIPMSIEGGAGITGIRVTVSYPPEHLTCVKVLSTGVDPEKTLLYKIDDDIGQASIVLTPSQPFGSVKGDAEFATLVFAITPAPTAVSCTLTVAGVYCTDDFVETALTEKTAVISIPLPVLGDLNGDGVVDATDVTLMAHILLGAVDPAPYLATADFNGDGVIDIADFAKLLAFLHGTVPKL